VDNLWKIISLYKGFFLIFPVFSIEINVFESGLKGVDFGKKWSENGDRWRVVDKCGDNSVNL
jgi:hypothetical protein